ncbi:hypothetical protein [Butyrivibrio sp. MB2005]|uniref:hypothetical protein n=1 Tax=Butyrivibrio sp. MB2005 TaxID=1280678 RepID=UPI0003FE7395|nr:hypothetical protein [Butyrivibrio sp. MB2005]
MDFEEFKEAITKDVKEAVDERLGTNTEVEIRHNNKTNYSYDALIPISGKIVPLDDI